VLKRMVLLVTCFLSLVALLSCGKNPMSTVIASPKTNSPAVEIASVATGEQVFSRLRPDMLESIYIKLLNSGNTPLTGLKGVLTVNDPFVVVYPAYGQTLTSEFGTLAIMETSGNGVPRDNTGALRSDIPTFVVQTGHPLTAKTVDLTLTVTDDQSRTWTLPFQLVFKSTGYN